MDDVIKSNIRPSCRVSSKIVKPMNHYKIIGKMMIKNHNVGTIDFRMVESIPLAAASSIRYDFFL